MKQIPAYLWFAPLATGLSYLVVFILVMTIPDSPENKAIGDLVFGTGQVAVLAAMVLFHKLNLNGTGFWKKCCLFIPAFGAISYTIGLLSIYTGETIILFFPAGALLSGLGMLIVGIQVARSKKLKHWKRFTPLLVGLYPFVIMFPIVIITGSPSIHAILLWGIPWTVMGRVLLGEYYGLKKTAIV